MNDDTHRNSHHVLLDGLDEGQLKIVTALFERESHPKDAVAVR